MADAQKVNFLQTEEVILTNDLPTQAELVSLYASVGWKDDLRDPQALERAVCQSSFVVCARADTAELLGLVRALSDDVTVCFVQDLLVRPEAHRQGLGRALLGTVMERYAHVKDFVLLTGSDPVQQAFYSAVGLKNTRDTQVNCFYRSTRH